MDFGRIIIFLPLSLYSFYSFLKNKEYIYLLLGFLCWVAAIYSGNLNMYQFLPAPIKSIINVLTIFILISPLVLFFLTRIMKAKK